MREGCSEVTDDLPITGNEARELLTECCLLLERERCARADYLTASCVDDAPQRAEDRVRQALAQAGQDWERPSLRGVVAAAESLAAVEAVGYPEFAWHLDRFAAYCLAESLRR